MTERPKKKQCTCSYDPITNELISAWGCECGADIWNTCIDAWEAWEKENQRIERLDEDSVDDVVFNAYKDLYEPFRKNIVKAICSKFVQPKDAVSMMKIEDIRDELLRLEYKENIGDNEYKKLNPNLIREIIKAILYLIPSNQPVNDAVSVQEIERVIDFDLRHLVSKVTDERDYISRDKRIEGHRQSIAQAIHALITSKLKGQDNESV